MITTLNKLPLGTSAKILDINCSSNIKRRFLDLGFIKNTRITPILKSPSGDPVAFEIRGSTIAIREEDTKFIKVEFYKK